MASQSTPESLALDSGYLPNGARAQVFHGDAIDDAQAADMLQVLQAAFNDRWPAFELPGTPLDHLRWKMAGPEPGAPSYVTLVEMDGELASLTVTVRAHGLLAGREISVEIGGDACTHPDYERRGLYRQRRTWEEGNIEQWLDCGFTFSLNPTVLRQRQENEIEGELANRPRVLLRIFDPRILAADRIEAGSRIPGPALASAFAAAKLAGSALSLRSAPRRSWDFAEVDRFDERSDRLFDAAAEPFHFLIKRSSNFLNWRYRDPRGGIFSALAAVDGDRVLGYVVFKTQKRRGYVVDVLALPGREDVVHSLVHEVCRRFAEERVMGAICWLPDQHPYRSALRRAGFLDSRQPTGSGFRFYPPLADAPRDILRDKRAPIHVTLGCTDWA